MTIKLKLFYNRRPLLGGTLSSDLLPSALEQADNAGTDVSGWKMSAIFRDPKAYSGQDFEPT